MTAWGIAGQFSEEYGGFEMDALEVAPARETAITLKESPYDFPVKDTILNIFNRVSEASYIVTLLQRTDIPEELKECVVRVTSRGPCDVQIKNLDYPVVGFLSDEAMKTRSMEYRTKYGIHIEMCKVEDLCEKLQQWKENPPPSSPFGLIVMPRIEGTHVTPLLCHFTQDKQQVVIMDALGAGGFVNFYNCTAACKTADIDYRYADLPRQVDPVSCRTSAVVLLRNALLDIKNKQNTSNFKDIITMTRPNSDTIFDLKLAIIIPCEWDYHEQITNRSQPADEVYVPRQPISKKNSVSVKDFRNSHTNEATFEYQLQFSIDQNGYLKLANLTYPPDIKIDYTRERLYLTWRAKKEVNTYLVYKSKRNAMKVKF